MRIVDQRFDTVFAQFLDDVRDLRVPQIRHIFLEREPQYPDASTCDRASLTDEQFYSAPGDACTHLVVDAPSGQDDFRTIAQSLCRRR